MKPKFKSGDYVLMWDDSVGQDDEINGWSVRRLDRWLPAEEVWDATSVSITSEDRGYILEEGICTVTEGEIYSAATPEQVDDVSGFILSHVMLGQQKLKVLRKLKETGKL